MDPKHSKKHKTYKTTAQQEGFGKGTTDLSQRIRLEYRPQSKAYKEWYKVSRYKKGSGTISLKNLMEENTGRPLRRLLAGLPKLGESVGKFRSYREY